MEENGYLLTMIIAKRAKQLLAGGKPLIKSKHKNPVAIALEEVKKINGKPVCIIANTIKGKGVSFMENIREWHGKAPSQQEYKIAIKEIEGKQ
jgi:transketolase